MTQGPSPVQRPSREVRVDVGGVQALLEAQCPELAGESVHLIDEGWDNFTFVVGQDHAARLPRREAAVPLLVNEQRWLPLLAPRLPLAAPTPVHAGTPGCGFPWPWSVVPWIRGATAESHACTLEDATLLAATLRALHQAAPEEAPVNPYRGRPLTTTAEKFETRLARLRAGGDVDAPRLSRIWQEGCDAPEATDRRWIHGDLHPRNVIVRDGAVVGLIDWGDITGGDVATDLACAWLLIAGAAPRRRFLDAYGASEDEMRRARGWAVHIGVALADSGDAQHVPIGLAALDRVTDTDEAR